MHNIGSMIGGVNGDKVAALYSHLKLIPNVKRVSITDSFSKNPGSDYKAGTAQNISSSSSNVRSGNNFSGIETKIVARLNNGTGLMQLLSELQW